MNRRSFLSFLGIAPIAAPAAAMAAQDSSQGIAVIDRRTAGAITFEAQSFYISSPALPDGPVRVTHEMKARVHRDGDLATRIDGVMAAFK